jgi:hypothetical protein
MMAPGFRPVGWVGAVAAAALGCYMLSLNVASERADLSRVERQIIATKQDIRSLQTELGTRGRLAQLEQWNGEVLALAAPAPTQFLDSEVKLARFDRQAPTLEDRAVVRMASADTTAAEGPPAVAAQAVAAPAVARKSDLAPKIESAQVRQIRAEPAPKKIEARVITASASPSSQGGLKANSLVHRASLEVVPVKRPLVAQQDNAVAAPKKSRVKASKGIDQSLAREIGAAAKAEAGAGRQ